MNRRAAFRTAFPGALLCALLLAPAARGATSCPAPGPLPEVPVALSANPRFFSYKGTTAALLGQSYEYLCHISQPAARQSAYCTLENFPSVLARMQNDGNNVLQLWTVFNSSPGASTLGAPSSNDEQPFQYIPPAPPATLGTWDLRAINPNYLANLETVVCNAYNKDIFVEVTLLDPWSPDWTTSPFNPKNTIDPDHQGFTQRGYFASLTGDAIPQNNATRGYQRAAVAAVVSRLKKYPNVLFQVANEPDFIPSAANLGVAVQPADVAAWQKNMIATAIAPNDTAHLLAINGHTSPAFAWSLGTGAKIDTLHYTQSPTAGVYGAISLLRDPAQTAARAKYAIGFNETHVIPDGRSPVRTADDVRSEAWEFIFSGGGLYDGYSTNFSDPEAMSASVQLGNLASALRDNFSSLALLQPSGCNGPSDWCKGLPPWGTPEPGGCPAGGAKIYWSTLKSETEKALYIHHGVPRSQLSGQNGQDAYTAIPCLMKDGTLPGYTASLQYQVTQAGCWSETWRDPKTLTVLSARLLDLSQPSHWYPAASPPAYARDVFFLLSLHNPGPCPKESKPR